MNIDIGTCLSFTLRFQQGQGNNMHKHTCGKCEQATKPSKGSLQYYA